MGVVSFNFEKLKVYQKSLDFIDSVYKMINNFPKEEVYGITSQFKRAALSIALNISEGQGDTDAQFNRYLTIARNSIKECVTCSTVSRRLGYISEDENNAIREKLEELSKMVSGLKNKLTK